VTSGAEVTVVILAAAASARARRHHRRGGALVHPTRAPPRRRIRHRSPDRARQLGEDERRGKLAAAAAHGIGKSSGVEPQRLERETERVAVAVSGHAMRPERVHADAVPEQLPAQLADRTAMPMTHDRARLVDEPQTGVEHPREHLGVAAALCRRARVECLVERADRVERGPPEGHVRSGPDVPRTRRRKRSREHPTLVARPRARHPLQVPLEQLLCRRLELQRQHRAAHSGDPGLR
jgi:hypothetical protein